MVFSRGINVRIVSQIEARRLPEYVSISDLGTSSTAATCYVPIHPGAQTWLEYWIIRPHAPGSIWLFKLFVDGKHVTSWDATAKHGYCGKTAYSLHTAPYGLYGQHQPMQNSFRFGSNASELAVGGALIELRVHRVAKPQRIRGIEIDPPAASLRSGVFK